MDLRSPGTLDAALGVLGFILLLIGGSMVEKVVGASTPVEELFVLAGLALVVVGLGLYGAKWAGHWSEKTPSVELVPNSRWSVILTLASTLFVSVVALWADAAGNVLWTAIAAGALGGLVHEIAQSKGTAFLPTKSSKGPQVSGSSPDTSAQGGKGTSEGDTGEDYLGGLIGLLLGGAAGLLALSSTTLVSPQLIGTAFAAGIAFKGIADAAASPSVKTAS